MSSTGRTFRCNQCGNPPLVADAKAGDRCQYDTCFGFLVEAEPAESHGQKIWMPQLRTIAARLGIEPTEDVVFLMAGVEGEMYDVGAIALALLDKIDKAAE